MKVKNKWSALDHQIHNSLLEIGFTTPKKYIWIAFSGGEDSSLLLDVLSRLRARWKWNLQVLHIHHGHLPIRDQMADFAKDVAKKSGLPFHCVQYAGKEALKSEADLRGFRFGIIQQLLQDPHSILVTGHHQDDLLETRLMRLFRGSGSGGLSAMTAWNGRVLRPFLHVSKSRIRSEIQDRALEYFDDPSNQDQNYLRNWLRHSHLPSIEKKIPGATRALARSLSLIAEARSMERASAGREKKIPTRLAWDQIRHRLELETLHSWLSDLGLRDFSKQFLVELQKKLRAGRPFSMEWKGLVLDYNAGQLSLRQDEKI